MRYHQSTTPPIEPWLRHTCSGKRRRWGVRSRRALARAECHTLIDVTVDEQEDSLIHFEWQTYYDPTMPKRLLRYNVLIRCELDLPVHSCVWHLLKDSRIKPSPLHWTEPINGNVVEYHYIVIEVGDLLPEDIFGREEVVLLPFVPLTDGGATRPYVERMLDKLSGEGHEEFAFVSFTLARAMFNKAHKQADCEWLTERYRAMNSMIHDLLDEDPLWLSNKRVYKKVGRRVCNKLLSA